MCQGQEGALRVHSRKDVPKDPPQGAKKGFHAFPWDTTLVDRAEFKKKKIPSPHPPEKKTHYERDWQSQEP